VSLMQRAGASTAAPRRVARKPVRHRLDAGPLSAPHREDTQRPVGADGRGVVEEAAAVAHGGASPGPCRWRRLRSRAPGCGRSRYPSDAPGRRRRRSPWRRPRRSLDLLRRNGADACEARTAREERVTRTPSPRSATHVPVNLVADEAGHDLPRADAFRPSVGRSAHRPHWRPAGSAVGGLALTGEGAPLTRGPGAGRDRARGQHEIVEERVALLLGERGSAGHGGVAAGAGVRGAQGEATGDRLRLLAREAVGRSARGHRGPQCSGRAGRTWRRPGRGTPRRSPTTTCTPRPRRRGLPGRARARPSPATP